MISFDSESLMMILDGVQLLSISNIYQQCYFAKNGSIFNIQNATLIDDFSSYIDDGAEQGGLMYTYNANTTESILGLGGFLFINEANFSNIDNLVLIDSYSASNGSQIYSQKNGLNFILSNSIFKQIERQALTQYPEPISAENSGGITLLNPQQTILIFNSFYGNFFAKTGGAIYIFGGTLSALRCNFYGMFSLYGASMYLDNLQESVLENILFSTSVARVQGAGLFIQNPRGDVLILGSFFRSLYSENEAACVYYIVEDSTLSQETFNSQFYSLEFRNVDFTLIQAHTASSIKVYSLHTNVYFSDCQLVQSYGQSYNSILIQSANLVDISNFYVSSIYSVTNSGFLYIDYVTESVSVRFSQIFCRTENDEYTNPPYNYWRNLVDNDEQLDYNYQAQRLLEFNFESIGQGYHSNLDIMTPIFVNSAKQFLIDTLYMQNCIMNSQTTPMTQGLIVFQQDSSLFVDMNSNYHDLEGLYSGIYSFNKNKAFLYNNTVKNLITNVHGAVYSNTIQQLFVHNCIFFNVTQAGGSFESNGGIFSFIADETDLRLHRTVTIRNSTFEKITMLAGYGGFIYQYDRQLLFIIQSITVRNVRANSHAIFYMIGLRTGLYISSLPQYQRTEFSDFFSTFPTQFLNILDGFQRVQNAVYIKDTTINCETTIISDSVNGYYVQSNEGIIRYEGIAGLHTENCIFKNCRKSNQGPIVRIQTYLYSDKGSQFYDLNGMYGSIVSCIDCTLLMQDSIIHDVESDVSGGAFYISGFSKVNLKNITAYNIKAKMLGGFLFNEKSSYRDDSIIEIQDSKNISNTYSNQGGFIYINSPNTNLSLRNNELKKINSKVQGGIFYVTDSDMILIENSKFTEFQSITGAFISSSSFSMRLVITASTIICDKFYNQDSEISDLSDWQYQSSNKGQFQLQNIVSITLRNNIFQKCGKSSQGGLFSLQKTSFTDYKSIYSANSGQYGGVINAQETNVSLTQSQFIGNLAQTAGAIYAVSNSNISISNCKFVQNQATKSAGAIYVTTQSIINIIGSSFKQNKAEENSALEILSTFIKENVTIQNCDFHDNYALKNTISMIYANAVFKDLTFKNNYAKYRSKNLLLGFVNITISNTLFQSKQLDSITLKQDETIGSFIFLIFDVFMDIDNCEFKNGASYLGGSIYISGDSFIRITKSQFTNSQANSKGGAIYSSGFKSIFIGEGSQFINNSALENGDDIYITNSFNILTIQNVYISSLNSKNSIYIESAILHAENMLIKDINQNSLSKRGAGLFCNYCKGFQIKSSQFINLKSIEGGAIYLIELDVNKDTTQQQNTEKFVIQNSQFHNCSAEIGGAINADNPQSLKIINSTFNQNKANIQKGRNLQIQNRGSGGAIYYTCNSQLLNCIMKFEGVNIFKDNFAEIQGGAIFWDELEPIYQKNDLRFANNIAMYYGNDIACFSQNLNSVTYQDYLNQMIQLGILTQDDQALRLLEDEKYSSIEIKSQRSGGSLPNLYMALQDKYGQIVGSDFKSKVRVSVETTNLDAKQSLYPPILEGTLSFDIVGGIALIYQISISGNPGSAYKLVITTDGIDLSKKSNQDEMAEKGTLNLDSDLQIQLRECEIGEQFTVIGKCQKCEQSFSLIKMKQPGTCENCPTEKAICNGGAEIGPQPGFWRKNNQSKVFIQCLFAQACLGMVPPQNNPLGECFIGYQGILCADCMNGYSRDNDYQCAECPEPALNVLRLITIFIAIVILIVLIIRSTLKGAQDINNVTSIYLKILLNHFQLILMTASFDFQWSQQIVSFFTTTKQVATQSTQIFSFDCFLDTRGESKGSQMSRIFFQKLIIIALLPFLLAIISSLIWNIYKKLMRNSVRISSKIMSSLVILLFLVHPSLVTYSFNDFKCKEVDGQYRVQDDLEIICWSPEHTFYSYFVALPCIIVWGLGIPFFALSILIAKRKKLDNFEIRQRFGFLYRGYRKDYYYWEIVIMYRKILIIFAAVFISNFGIVAQALIVFFILIIFLLINFKKQPFNTLVLNDLETLSLITSMVTIYCGLFFILNKPKTWIEENPDYARGSVSLSIGFQRFFFALILFSNLLFFAYWALKIKIQIG
ncbi:UNKNOWN [Stylonychia lemnae]|uniref:Transmembrane protein n=1 Tax=Stylonychia lemnae TaxID=5949 RepID=A0A078AJB6_STYLE|nr:UNKNOWN [Stylonychia lemnae]|eukprot:CDW82324.1 UNKNOWN [Stylonychia lemnae]